MKMVSRLLSLTSILSSLVVLAALSPGRVSAAPGDEHWDPLFGLPGPGGNNWSVTTHNGKIYVSGLASTTNVALQVWDGAQWTAASQFYGYPSGTIVYDLAFLGETLYAAGLFTNIDGVTVTNFAQWDGNTWSPVGFYKGTPRSLAVDNGKLYVGGGFTNIGGVAITNIGYWDGSAWHALGDGVGNYSQGLVYSVVATNGIVYAGGYFTNSGALACTNVARWDGSSWSAPGGGVGAIVRALALKGTELYALSGSSSSTALSKWDGTSWTVCGSTFDNSAQSVAVLGNLVCVGGTFTKASGVSATRFAVWNGTSWSAAGAGPSADVNRLYSTGTNLYVAGVFMNAGGMIANGLASWDGTRWASLGSPYRMNGLSLTVSALASDGVNLYAGGTFTSTARTNVNYVARWDGTNWYPVGGGVSGYYWPSVKALALSGNNVYVGGSFSSAGTTPAANLAVWDGTGWSAFGSGPGGVVAALAVRPEGIYAAGAAYYNPSTPTYAGPYCVRWNGSSWQSLLAFNPNDTMNAFYFNDSNIGIDALAFMGNDVYIGGRFSITWYDPSFTVFIDSPNIMRFDGTYCRVVGTGCNSNVTALAVMGSNLYAGGWFTSAGGQLASHIARWDGNQWYPVGGGVVGNGTVYALATVGNYLYAGGTFTNMGGVTASRIARWDGTAWSALGSGVSSTVFALAGTGDDLYAGGSLRSAGGKTSYFLGHWNDQINFHIPQLVSASSDANGQFCTRLVGIAGLTNMIQATTDFRTWTPVWTNSVGICDFLDPASPNYPKRFYRALLSQ